MYYYCVVEYNDCYREQSFEVIMTTDDLEYAKKVAFLKAKIDMTKYNYNYSDETYKITTVIDNEYNALSNKIIVSYKVATVEKSKNGFKFIEVDEYTYSVIQIKKDNFSIEDYNIEEIDTSLICNDFDNGDDDKDIIKEQENNEDKKTKTENIWKKQQEKMLDLEVKQKLQTI